jgi:hypothetical protein
MQTRVTGIQEPIEIAAAPPADKLDPHVERRADAPKGIERLRTRVTPLDPGDRRLRRTGLGGEVGLSPPSPLADRADRRPESLVVHF